ncbi:ORF6N domain-containing protein [Lactiplantibacillus pentosus]|nr:ORF6N domain-containing protein [Lactiplantibacillus pentosus]UXI96190.1 ORF6N domain-containing protein [Lactiplantibacillus pentosus]
MADLYGNTTRRITDNFNANQRRFIKGKHYFYLEGEALKHFKNQT